jgi:citrate lyase subunit beta/citryl-CoA lyase
MAPKVRRPDEIEWMADRLDDLERDAKVAHGTVRIIPSIESAAALLEAPRIAKASERVVGLAFGSEDFALDLGLPTRREGEAADLLYARSATVVAAASAGKLAFDGIWPDIKDAAGLRADALRAHRLGFAGKTLIHPDQILVVNEIFSPTAAEVEEARRVVHAFDEALKRGEGAVALDGQMLDAPIVDRARRVLRAGERNS